MKASSVAAERDERLPPEPPPVPASHPAGKNRILEALRIPAYFYIEALFGGVVLLAIYLLAGQTAYAPVLLISASLAIYGTCAWRMVRRVLAARAKGRPPWEATAVYWVAILVPIVAATWYLDKARRELSPESARATEARALLERAARVEKDFHATYGKYTYNVKELGIDPVPGARYVLGFPAACTVKFSVEGAKATQDLLDFGISHPKDIAVGQFFRETKRAEDCVDPKEGYEIYVVGVVRDDLPLDVWKADESGKIVNLSAGR